MLKTSCKATWLTVLVLVFISSLAFAKSSKYSRPGSSDASTDSSDSSQSSGSQSSSNSSAGKAATPSATPAPNGKVDLTDLESRYWTAKDTEFNVVQNRLYTKAKRFSITPMVGLDLSSQYTNDFNLGLQINYYFSERQGVGLQGWKTSGTEANFATTFESTTGASYNYNNTNGFIGVNYNWIPIYAKLSLLEKKILYFDMSFNPGIGATFLSSHTFSTTINQPSPVTQTPLTLALDVSQQVFLNEHWAIKLDLDSHIYSETTYAAATGSQYTVGQSVSSKITYAAVFMLGVTFFQ